MSVFLEILSNDDKLYDTIYDRQIFLKLSEMMQFFGCFLDFFYVLRFFLMLGLYIQKS